MSTSEELKTLKRIEELLEAIARNALRDTLNSALVDKEHKFLYENTGRLPVKELARKTGFSTGSISRTWQAWEEAGLLLKDGKQYKKVL
jgi:hypothetical protein